MVVWLIGIAGILLGTIEQFLINESCAPKDCSVGEILRLTEGSLAPVACLEGETNTCPRADGCLSLPVWHRLDTLINDYLNSVSLADLLAESGAR